MDKEVTTIHNDAYVKLYTTGDYTMYFEFEQMKEAKAFVAAVKKQFNVEGEAFDDDKVWQATDPNPYRLERPIASIQRSDRAVDGLIIAMGKRRKGWFFGT